MSCVVILTTTSVQRLRRSCVAYTGTVGMSSLTVACRFVVAGHETSSTAAMWAIFALAQAPDIQGRLRDELLQVPTDWPTMDELNALHYLDLIVKETLRLYAPVPMTAREATQDCFIPLSKPYIDEQGKAHEFVK